MSNLISSSTTPTKMASMATRGYSFIISTTNNKSSSSLTLFRRLSCAASLYPARLVPHPPDLIKWVKIQGGFVHPSVRISELDSYGFGLVASHEIPKGSDLIALPDHIPLKFGESGGDDASYSVLLNLVRHVPGIYFSFLSSNFVRLVLNLLYKFYFFY